MERSERLSLIQKIGLRLGDESFTDLKLTLSIFELPTGYWDENEYLNQYAYVVDQLKAGSDAQLAELHRHLFPGDTVSAAPSDGSSRWAAGTFRLFLSHTTSHRAAAARLRSQLAEWAVDTFVAHDVIEPTREWQDEIEAALRTCDALAAMLTTDFVESRWCDQEVGCAVARGVLIVPMKIDADPHGFIGKYQAVTIPAPTTPYVAADLVFDVLARSAATSEAMVPAIVRRYANSDSVDNTRAAYVLLETIPDAAWTQSMIEQVDRAANLNSKVRDAVLPGGRKVAEAVQELLKDVRPDVAMESDFQPAPIGGSGDDDIPF